MMFADTLANLADGEVQFQWACLLVLPSYQRRECANVSLGIPEDKRSGFLGAGRFRAGVN
jgi:hypothetical protein